MLICHTTNDIVHKIAVISDTHGLLRQNMVSILQTCDAIMHAGDFSSQQVYEQLKTIAPLYAVRGNTDKKWAANIPDTLSVELSGIRFFMIHNRKLIRENIQDRDIIIYGHSHKYEQFQKDGQFWLNPGSCGPGRFSLPVTMAVITIPEHVSFKISRVSLTADAKHPADTPASRLPKQLNMRKTVLYVMKETDRGKSVTAIAKGCHITEELAEQICRLYLTHPGVDADGILTKMGL